MTQHKLLLGLLSVKAALVGEMFSQNPTTLVPQRRVVETSFSQPFNPYGRLWLEGLGHMHARALTDRLWLVDAGSISVESLLQHPDICYVGEVHRDEGGTVWYVLPEFFVKPQTAEATANLLEEARKRAIEFVSAEQEDSLLLFRFSKHSEITPAQWAMELQSRSDIVLAEPDLGFHPLVAVNDPLFPYQWALKNTGSPQQGWGTPGADIEAEAAWSITTGSPSIKIAILDSGVDTLHPDLKPNLLPGYDATGQGSQGYPNVGPFASDGHGTSCAGIAAAAADNGIGIAGVAYTCKIVPVKMFYYIDTTLSIPGIIDTTLQEIPFSTTQFMLNAINWARNTAKVDVMSNSWGIPPNLLPFAPINQNTVSNAIRNAATLGRNGKGIPMFFSSGNDNDILIWPASYHEYAISVGASTNKDKRASYSNYGQYLDFVAPGHLLYTTDFTGPKGYSSGDYVSQFAGTSAACPVAAAIGALVLSVRPDFTAGQVRRCLRQSAEKVGGYNYDSLGIDGTWNNQMGYGRLNAHAALMLAPQLSLTVPEKSEVLQVYPNPCQGVFYLNLSGLLEKEKLCNVIISSAKGERIHFMRKILRPVENNLIELPSHLPAGVYFCHIHAGERQGYFRLVVFR